MHHLTRYQLLFLRRRHQWQRLAHSMALATIGIAMVTGICSVTPAMAHDPDAVYTAQHRPRVAVSVFEDTNTDAGERRYGPSVSAMLVTFFKTEGQLTVVERLDLEQLVQEWERTETGVTKATLMERQQLLEIIDVILEGKVTMLPDETIEIDAKLLAVDDARILAAARKHGPIDCLRQVVDSLGATLQREHLKPFAGNLRVSYDGPPNTRIFLTPVLHVDAPPDARPAVELKATILSSDDARDDRLVQWITQPSSVIIRDLLAGWYIARLERPGYRFHDVDSGKFEARGNRRGSYGIFYCRKPHDCRSAQTDTARRTHWGKHLVYVSPFATTEVNLRSASIPIEKQMGRLHLQIRDESNQPVSGARVMLRSLALDINPWQDKKAIQRATTCEKKPEEALTSPFAPRRERRSAAQPAPTKAPSSPFPFAALPVFGSFSSITQQFVEPDAAERATPPRAENPTLELLFERFLDATYQLMAASPQVRGWKPEDSEESRTVLGPWSGGPEEEESCDFLELQPPRYLEFDDRRVSEGLQFHSATFPGGDLVFEHYEGAEIPVGQYEVLVWAPDYETYRRQVDVHSGSWEEPFKIDLQRLERAVQLHGWPDGSVEFAGETTGIELLLSSDQMDPAEAVHLPVDKYHALVRQPNFPDWHKELELRDWRRSAPSVKTFRDPCQTIEEEPLQPRRLEIKNRPWVAGRVAGFLPDPSVYYDRQIADLLDKVLEMPTGQEELSKFLSSGKSDLDRLKDALEHVDLLILNEDDVSRLRVLPALRTLVHEWLGEGRALLAFVAYQGNYGRALGAPLVVQDNVMRSTLSLHSELVEELAMETELELEEPRLIPKVEADSLSQSHWRVLGVEGKKQAPRILESLQTSHGGYVLVWLETIEVQAVPKDENALFTYGDILRSGLRQAGAAAIRGAGSGYQSQQDHFARRQFEHADGDPALGAEAKAKGAAIAGVTDKTADTLETADRGRMSARRRNRLKLDLRRVEEANTQILLLKAEIQNRALEHARTLMRQRLNQAPMDTPLPEARSVDETSTLAVSSPRSLPSGNHP